MTKFGTVMIFALKALTTKRITIGTVSALLPATVFRLMKTTEAMHMFYAGLQKMSAYGGLADDPEALLSLSTFYGTNTPQETLEMLDTLCVKALAEFYDFRRPRILT